MTSLTASASTAYRGADRRMAARVGPPSRPLPVRSTATVVLLAAACAGVLADADPVRALALQDLRQVLRAALFTGTGLLLLAQWRVTGLTRPALLGFAFLVLGVLSEATTGLAPLLLGAHDQHLSTSALRLLPALAAAALLVAARRSYAVDAALRPIKILSGALVVGAFGGVGVLLLSAGATRSEEAQIVAGCAAWRGALWLALALLERRSGRDGTPWLAPVLAVMSLTAFLDAGAALEGEPMAAAAAVFAVLSGVLALRGAAADVARSLSEQSARLLHLTADVTEHQERRRTAEQSEAVRLHEARNVLAGLHGATSTLRRYEDRLDPGVRHRLEDAISAELQRLQHLVDPPMRQALGPVPVAEALEPILTAERELGALIRADLHRVIALGCAEDVATICSALLVNARVHAPGVPVLVRSRRVGRVVRIVVEDGGPGIPDEHRESVFSRGGRGAATAAGSGLGLFNARELASAMGGTLELVPRPTGGAAFVLDLPAVSAGSGQLIPQQRQRRAGSSV